MGTLIQDLRFALRTLRRTPAFPLAAIGTLALGIGATTAIFSTVNAALLRPLPYAQDEDLYSVRTTLTDGRPTTGLVSPVEVLRLNDLSSPASSIVHVVGMQTQPVTLLRDDGTPIKTDVYGVSEGFFNLFGLPMTIGPGLTPDNFLPNATPTVVISYRVWQDMFGGDPAIVGKQVRFVEITATIGGVAPRNFDTPHGAGFWFGQPLTRQDVNHSFEGFMRVRPGADLNRVRGEMASVMGGLAHDFPVSDVSRAYVVRPLVESIVGDLGPILIIVLSATALLLVLACANVTNLLLARGAARAKEVAIRVALGASRGRIVRQLLTESILLATAGALLGLAVAASGVRARLALGAGKLPRLDAVPFDSHVLLFALAVLFASGVLVGFAPALRLASSDTKTLMNDSTRSSTGGRGTMRWLNAMTIAEIALAVTLVAGAGWLVRGFANLRTTDPGFVADGLLTFDVSFQSQKYRDQTVALAAQADLLDRLRALSGVKAVGATSNFPLRGTQENSLYLQLHGEAADPRMPKGTRQRFVTPGFFDAMGIKLISGRDFTDADRMGSAPVVIVNRTFARHYLTGLDPLQTRFAAGYPTIDPANEAAIIGIVDDVRQKSLTEAAEPAYLLAVGAVSWCAAANCRRQDWAVGSDAARSGHSRRRAAGGSADRGRFRLCVVDCRVDDSASAARDDADAGFWRHRGGVGCRWHLRRDCVCDRAAPKRSRDALGARRDARACVLARAGPGTHAHAYRRRDWCWRRVRRRPDHFEPAVRSSRVRSSDSWLRDAAGRRDRSRRDDDSRVSRIADRSFARAPIRLTTLIAAEAARCCQALTPVSSCPQSAARQAAPHSSLARACRSCR